MAAGVEAGKMLLRAELGMAEGDDGNGNGKEAEKQEDAMEEPMNGVVDADYATHFGFEDMGVDGPRELPTALEVKE